MNHRLQIGRPATQRHAVGLLLLLLAALPAHAQQKPLAPVTPEGTLAQERAALARAEELLSKGEFGKARQAASALVVPDDVRVSVDWAGAPAASRDAWRQAAERAIATWNGLLRGTPKLRLTRSAGSADVAVQFADQVDRPKESRAANALPPGSVSPDSGIEKALPPFVCIDARLRQGADTRGALVRISANEPGSKTPHSSRSMEHLFAHAIGVYLGVEPTPLFRDAMGPDTHDARTTVAPSNDQVALVAQLRKVRAALLDLAKRRVAARIAHPVLFVGKAAVDLGDVWQGTVAKFEVPVRNDGEGPLTISTASNCGCTATTSVIIEAGVGTQIDGQLRTDGLIGPVTKALYVASNDPARRSVTVELKANVKLRAEFKPSDHPVIDLNSDGPTAYEATLVLNDPKPVLVEQVRSGQPWATAVVRRVAGAANTFKLAITVRPEAPMGRSAFRVVVATTSQQAPEAVMTVTCQKGIGASPPGLYLGAIRPATRLPLTQVITLSRHGEPFKVLRIDTGDAALTAKDEAGQDGREHRITVSYGGGWAVGSIKRKLVIETDDARQPRIEVPITANVLDGAAGKP